MSSVSVEGTVSCLNCMHTYTGKFCNHCGQKAATHRYTVTHVIHDLPHHVFHLDKGILKNIKSIIHPRKTIADYISGKRVAYFNPMLFFFMTSGSVMLLEYASGDTPNFVMDIAGWEAEGYDSSTWLTPSVKYIYFFSAFLYAIVNTFLFRKETSFNYAEHVLTGIFVLGYVNIAYIPFIYSSFGGGFPLCPPVLVLSFIFTFLAFYRGKWWVTLFKSLLSVSGWLVIFILFLFLLAFIGFQIHLLTH